MIAAASSAGGKPALSYNLILKVHRGAVEMMCIYIYMYMETFLVQVYM